MALVVEATSKLRVCVHLGCVVKCVSFWHLSEPWAELASSL